MTYKFSQFTKRIGEIEEWLKAELGKIQTGRASAGLLDSIRVDSYGAKTPLNQVASVANEDARTLRITPWDTTMIQAIYRAIEEANLGLSLSSDEQGVRVAFPELTTETREKYVKMVKNKLEEARVSLRQERDDVRKDIQKQEKEGGMSGDEKKRAEEELEKIVKDGNGRLDTLAEHREKEIRG